MGLFAMANIGPSLPEGPQRLAALSTFPSFLPSEVHQIEEAAAKLMASKIVRLPVQTSFCDKPILTSCVPPNTDNPKATPLLLLHGFDSSCLEWRRAFPLLNDAGLAPWAVDMLGWGFSSSEGKIRAFDAKAKTDHLYEFWKTHIKRPVVLVGPSLGGAASIQLAVTYPEMVDKLVLVDPQAYVEGLGSLANSPKVLLYGGAAVLKSFPLRAYANVLAFKNGVSYGSSRDLVRVGRLHCFMEGWADALVDFMTSGGYNVASKVSQVKQETLIVWGSEDKIIPVSEAQRFLVDIPNARFEEIMDCGHIPHVERPLVVADLLSKFCKKRESALI